jgi:hypothetical protein
VRVAEAKFQDQVRQLGCIICRLFHGVFSPCEIHHMLRGGRRMGEMFVLGLCPTHHRSGRNDDEVVSRDQNQRRFEKRYGTEESLLSKTRELVQARLQVVTPQWTTPRRRCGS